MYYQYVYSTYVTIYNLQETKSQNIQLSKEISDGKSLMKMKQSEIDDLEKNLKLITLNYQELKLKVHMRPTA